MTNTVLINKLNANTSTVIDSNTLNIIGTDIDNVVG